MEAGEKIVIHGGVSVSGAYVRKEHFDRILAERDALQSRLNSVEGENDRLRIALNIQRIQKPATQKSCAVDCEDCGDTGAEPCSLHAK